MANLVEILDKDNFIPYCPNCSRSQKENWRYCDMGCMKEVIKRLYLKEQEDMEFIKRYKISPIQAAAWKFDKIKEY